MLKLVIPNEEYFDEDTGEFLNLDGTELALEHSLLSISKWEANFHKPFFAKEEKTLEEVRYYVQCMLIHEPTENELKAIDRLGMDQYKTINEYLEDTQSATTITDLRRGRPGSTSITTSEQIYAAMILRRMPLEMEKWPFNRLMTVIRIIDIEQGSGDKSNKMSRSEAAAWQREQNELRRQKFKTKG